MAARSLPNAVVGTVGGVARDTTGVVRGAAGVLRGDALGKQTEPSTLPR